MVNNIDFIEDSLTDIYAPFTIFTAQEWSQFRGAMPLTLNASEIETLRSFNDPIDVEEVEKIYLSLSRLLSKHVELMKELFYFRQNLFHKPDLIKTPFIIGIAGSVAVGKSTTARILQALLKRWPSNPKVSLVTTDGFLYPNAILQQKDKLHRKGFPDSYDKAMLLNFLSSIKSGVSKSKMPIYSHFFYDIIPDKYEVIDSPDILIIEGINVLQTGILPKDKKNILFVSDFFDFSIYIDADVKDIERWYLERFMRLRSTAFRDPSSYFHRYSTLSDSQALERAQQIWHNINYKNLIQNILPTKPRADLILRKNKDHFIEYVALKRL